jgi:hypothetical protein
LKALSYIGGIVHHRIVAGIQARKPMSRIADLSRAPRVCAHARAHVAANFANFGGYDGH